MNNKIEKAKEIIAKFLKISPSEIKNSTIIDRSVLPGSIIIHRMYSLLSREDIETKNYHSIKTFGDLLKEIDKSDPNLSDYVEDDIKIELQEKPPADIFIPSIGIDIENISNLPECEDYREDDFYKNNFSQKEIAYCLIQPDIKASFAGKFAAKEAIIKADNSLKPFVVKNSKISFSELFEIITATFPLYCFNKCSGLSTLIPKKSLPHFSELLSINKSTFSIWRSKIW